ncbi:MAG: CGGC domain-containing protein [Desulfovibrionaceae bacterium]|nr:CGGC domain-containing protein [Desulfovibrionaceae bacterium]MBR5734556.1 CGGC domain-containing protein [Desulfovibrionaceae bacterium]
MKVGIIRCQQTEHLCAGTKDLRCAAEGKGAFEALGPCEVVGLVSCGGCPGKNAVSRAGILVKAGAEAIALASCITLGLPMDFPCPHREKILGCIRSRLGDSVTVLDHTHEASGHAPKA